MMQKFLSLFQKKEVRISTKFIPNFDICNSLEETVFVYKKLYEIEEEDVDFEVEQWRKEMYEKIMTYIDPNKIPCFDDIDAMLTVASILLDNNKIEEYTKFIFTCPPKFIITYSNNSEKTPLVLHKLISNDLNLLYEYLAINIDPTKLNTWRQRYGSK